MQASCSLLLRWQAGCGSSHCERRAWHGLSKPHGIPQRIIPHSCHNACCYGIGGNIPGDNGQVLIRTYSTIVITCLPDRSPSSQEIVRIRIFCIVHEKPDIGVSWHNLVFRRRYRPVFTPFYATPFSKTKTSFHFLRSRLLRNFPENFGTIITLRRRTFRSWSCSSNYVQLAEPDLGSHDRENRFFISLRSVAGKFSQFSDGYESHFTDAFQKKPYGSYQANAIPTETGCCEYDNAQPLGP